MSKAILVLDEMPNRCSDCKFFYIENLKPMCMACANRLVFTSKPGWCPLEKLDKERFAYDVTKGQYIEMECEGFIGEQGDISVG